MTIHPTAIVDSEARLSENVTIGPYAVVEADVEVGEGTAIGAHTVLKSGLRLGKRVTVCTRARKDRMAWPPCSPIAFLTSSCVALLESCTLPP